MLLLNVRFILDTLKEEYYKGTKFSAEYDHWRPQHKLCPFCLLNFRSENIKTLLYLHTFMTFEYSKI